MEKKYFYGFIALVGFFAFANVTLTHAQSVSPIDQNNDQEIINGCSSALSQINQELSGIAAQMESLGINPSTISAFNEESLHGIAGTCPETGIIAGIQGFNPATNEYTDNVALAGTYLVLYGSFAPSGNTILIDGQAADATYQSAPQINISLSGIASGQHTVSVTLPVGTTATVTFTIANSILPQTTTPPANTTTSIATAVSIIPSNIGVYIWGSAYPAKGDGPIVDSVNFAVSKGFHIVRMPFGPPSQIDYGISDSCDPAGSLKATAQESQFAQAFANPSINTFALTTYDYTTFSDCATKKFLNPSFYSATSTAAIEQEYQDLTTYLYQTYHNTGKTFILDTWEGDNEIYCGNAYQYGIVASIRDACNQNYASEYNNGNTNPGQSFQGLQDWLTARTAGIKAGRAMAQAQGLTGVSVYSAAEFNIVHALHDNGYESVLYNVLPNVPLDYVSYSSYESINQPNPGSALATDLKIIDNVLPSSDKLFIGEFGYDEDNIGSSTAQSNVNQVVSTIQQAGLPYGIIWQLFDQSSGNFGLFRDNGQSELYSAFTPTSSQSVQSVVPASITNPPAEFPVTVLVTALALHVRSAPTMTASLTGSGTLYAGDEFIATNEIQGENIDGNDLWWVSSAGNYVWSGGTKLASSISNLGSTPKPKVANGTPPGQQIHPAAVIKTITSGGTQYSATYSYLNDGEVRAEFTYQNHTYAEQNYPANAPFAAADDVPYLGVNIALVQSDGTFISPYTVKATDLTFPALVEQIANNSPANQTIFNGFTFDTPLTTYTINSQMISVPADTYYILQSTYTNVPVPEFYTLDFDSNGNVVGVTPINLVGGNATIGTEILLQQTNASSSQESILAGGTPSQYLNSLTTSLQSAGYQISENVDALGQIVGMASKNGQPALYFNLGDQVATNVPQNSNGSCYLQTPEGGTPIPIEVNPDGTIPHISNNFNVVVDPGAYSAINWGGISNEEIQSDLIQAFLKGYYPYTQVGGLPQPTETPDANAIVIVAFANIPSVEYSYFDNNGQQVNQTINEAANTITLLPGSAWFNYVPSGSANLVINALNAGKQVVVVTYNSQYFANLANDQANEFYGDTEHEMGHTLGLDDDYENGASPMRGGDLASDGTIAIQPAIYNYLFDIQQKKTFTTVKCGTPQMLTTPSTGPNTDYVPIATNGSTNPNQILWVIQGSCTQEQLNDGYINYPLADGGCYLPTPTSSIVISFGSFPDQESETAICKDDYGNDYACASTNCGGAGQLACPVNIPQGTCLDTDGNTTTCPGTNGFEPILPPISPPPPPDYYECSSSGACVYNANGGMYPDATCNNACVNDSGE